MKSLQMEKKKRLIDSAMHLFLEQGVDETSVSDIAVDANLAKGTFYLYFKDKEALINEVIMKHNTCFFNDMMELSRRDSETQNISWSHAYLKRVITFYKENPHLLRMIQRCFSRQQNHAAFIHELHSQVQHFDAFLQALRQDGESEQEVLNRFILMMAMTGIVCHNAIYYQQPDTMEQIESMFYQNMCKSFAQGKERTS